jgi:RNA polymerase sigma-70 factor, ECF subfamily
MTSDAVVPFQNALLGDKDEGTTPSAQASSTLAAASDFPGAKIAFLELVKLSSDEDLLLQVGNGNKDALSILFQRHARAVHNVARRILKDHSEAEDLLQELFLFIFQKAKTFDAKKSSATSWIIQMAYHRAIDRRRYLGFRQHYNVQEYDETRLAGSQGQRLIEELAGKALLEKLRSELSTDQMQTLELHFFEGYSFHEIAEKTGQTFGNVRNHYYRGLERLRCHIFPGKTNPK